MPKPSAAKVLAELKLELSRLERRAGARAAFAKDSRIAQRAAVERSVYHWAIQLLTELSKSKPVPTKRKVSSK